MCETSFCLSFCFDERPITVLLSIFPSTTCHNSVYLHSHRRTKIIIWNYGLSCVIKKHFAYKRHYKTIITRLYFITKKVYVLKILDINRTKNWWISTLRWRCDNICSYIRQQIKRGRFFNHNNLSSYCGPCII